MKLRDAIVAAILVFFATPNPLFARGTDLDEPATGSARRGQKIVYTSQSSNLTLRVKRNNFDRHFVCRRDWSGETEFVWAFAFYRKCNV